MSLLPVKTQQVPIGAERPVVRSSKRCSLDDHDTRVEDFIGENELDERAAAALRGASLDLSEAVMMRGSLRGTRNKSSALLGRLRDAAAILTLNVAGEEAAKKRPHPPPPVSMVRRRLGRLCNTVDRAIKRRRLADHGTRVEEVIMEETTAPVSEGPKEEALAPAPESFNVEARMPSTPLAAGQPVTPPKTGWKRMESRSKAGVYYYFNQDTSVTSWEPPSPWEKKESRHSSGVFYYWNTVTGATSREKPEM